MHKAILKTIIILMNQTTTEIIAQIARITILIAIQATQTTNKFKYCLWCKPQCKVGEIPYFYLCG